jgi:hypothetical protein
MDVQVRVFLTSVQVEGVLLSSRPCGVTVGARVLGTHWIGISVGPRASRRLCRPASSQSLCRLCRPIILGSSFFALTMARESWKTERRRRHELPTVKDTEGNGHCVLQSSGSEFTWCERDHTKKSVKARPEFQAGVRINRACRLLATNYYFVFTSSVACFCVTSMPRSICQLYFYYITTRCHACTYFIGLCNRQAFIISRLTQHKPM